jgi:leucyl aminopeptidase
MRMVREIISVSAAARKGDPVSVKADVLAVGIFSDGRKGELCKALDKKLGGAISKVLKLGDFKGQVKATSLLYSEGRTGAERVLLVGLGERGKASLDTVRKAAAAAANRAVGLKARTICLALHQEVVGRKGLDAVRVGQALGEGAYFGAYRYDEYVAKGKDDRLKAVRALVAESDGRLFGKISAGVKAGSIVGQAQNYARTIANRPANVVSPEVLAAEARKLARNTAGLSCTVLNEKQLKQKNMGGILAVGQGSAKKPRLIILKYVPRGRSAKVKTIGLVGKAITFDSGGISIKPGEGMHDMKFDKSGGLAVLGTMKAIAALKPKVCVYGIIPSAENMPGGMSYRPGDIVTTYSGKTVEILNTDAEGRMLLCDAIHYAVRAKCNPIIDIATLTGSCVVALGQNRGGLMGNDDGLIKKLQAASERSGEQVWHLPCDDEYLELMKSKIADLKNIGGKWAGACTAGAFLGQFAGKAKWAHLDIAGAGVFGDKKAETTGSVGFGVRLLTEYVMSAR